ncbi:hypothetical protein PRIPAC_96981 [Pristionchus pacificus]|uniref:Uncharacterized protein n=1 Tax=Pristionchus pacificus TaxID=54126 RepID=A0A2A6D2D3_PRIPA|nr:hypothetical protein PRIPAC_96981 [Pristionchus pacificus]|eukprot:PDM84451.1 hypothetical protein PRIPAC_33474 [Pristionchus pacificus]
MNARIGISSSSHAHNLSSKKYSSIPGPAIPQLCPSCADNQCIDFPGGIDDSEVDEELLNEWDQLTEREYELEKRLERIEDAVHEKHLDIKFARAVILDIRRINARTPLRRQLTLLRMKEHAGKMVRCVSSVARC